MDLFIALVLKPFLVLPILVFARVIEVVVQRRMRDSWFKRLLFSPLPGQKRSRG